MYCQNLRNLFRPNIQDFIPKNLYGTRKSHEWAQSVLEAHENLIGKSVEDAKTEYLNIVKTWGYYGTTFYPPCKSVGNKSLHSKVVIGINYEGIRLLRPKNKVSRRKYLKIEIIFN